MHGLTGADALEDTMHPMDAWPLLLGLTGRCVGVVGLAGVEQVERGPVFTEAQPGDHRGEVVVSRHLLIAVEVDREGSGWVEHGQADQGAGVVAERAEVGRHPHARQHLRKAHPVDAQALLKAQQVALVVGAGEDIGGGGMGQQAHQEVVVRRCGPGRIAPPLLDLPQSPDVSGAGGEQGIEPAGVQHEQDKVAGPWGRIRHDGEPTCMGCDDVGLAPADCNGGVSGT